MLAVLQVAANNAALSEVHNLLTYWAGLSMVDRRTRQTKFHVVATLERCVVFQLLGMQTQLTPLLDLLDLTATAVSEASVNLQSQNSCYSAIS